MSAAKSVLTNIVTDSQAFMDKLQKDQPGFLKLSELLRKKAGINMVLNDKNLTLMASRLNTVIKKYNLNGYKDYLKAIETSPEKYLAEFIVCLTTNTTQFYRESSHFEYLEKVLPEILAKKEKQKNHEIRIWCSATSTGQEVYTTLMVLLKNIPNINKWSIKFLATDIDHEVLEKAAAGIYSQVEIQGIPKADLKVYFNQVSVDDEMKYQFKSEYRQMIRFATFNLLTEKFPFQYPFDISFCRNVLIYFDRATAEVVIDKIARSLTSNGLLFLGHSETGMMKSQIIKAVSNAVYTRIG